MGLWADSANRWPPFPTATSSLFKGVCVNLHSEKEMDSVHGELDKAKAEIECLIAEFQIEAELSESLKRTNNEQLNKIQEESLKVEKQAKELKERAEEISLIKRLYEDLKCSVNEKDSIIKHMSSVNDKFRIDCDKKLEKWEEEKLVMEMALDKANEKSIDQEQKIHAFEEEIEGLKGTLLVLQRKRSEAEEKANAPIELRLREDMLLKLEEENKTVEDELKWKKEQFKHLEDAHEKLRDKFCTCKKEWENEKSILLDEVCSLQTSLGSQTRISEDFQKRLMTCNQALAHEESRRKFFEVQLSESKAHFENVSSECEEAKSKIEHLTLHRDREIAALRNSLSTKVSLYKEMEYNLGKLEQENQDLRISLKELQEAQIHETGTSSMGKLRSKLKSLEQMHRGCSVTLRVKEAEWSSQLEKMTRELNDCRSELMSKDAAIDVFKNELEGCHSSIMQLKVQNEEISLMLSAFKTGLAETQSKLENERTERDLHDKEKQENILCLMKQLEIKNSALDKAQAAIEQEKEKFVSLLRRVESLDLIEQEKLLVQKEFERHREMLEESSKSQLCLKDQALQMESDFKEKLRRICDALDASNSELAEKIYERNETEFELQIWKSIAERLKDELEENHQKRREIEASLLEQVEVEETLKQEIDSIMHALKEKGRRIDCLQLQIELLTQELKIRRAETETAIESEQEITEQMHKISENHQKAVERMEQELVGIGLEDTIITQICTERSFEYEKEDLLHCYHFDLLKENVSNHLACPTKNVEVISNERSPFCELNN